MRNVNAEYGGTGNQARTVPPNASKNTTVRWSGHIEGAQISRGALYRSVDAKGLLNEAVRYQRETITRQIPWIGSSTGEAKYTVFGPAAKDYQKLLVGRIYYTFRLTRPIKVVDLTPSAAGAFYEAIEGDRQYQAAKKDLQVQPELWKIAFDPVDYTGSRPLGLSILLGYPVEGVRAETAQTEVPETAGLGANVVLSGDDGKQVEFLQPVGKLLAGTSDGHSALLAIKVDGTGTDHATVLPGSVLPTSPA